VAPVRPWETLDRVQTAEGELVLQRRGDEFVIAVAGRIVMSSRANHSERELATLVCAPLSRAPSPRLVVAGLGMGLTLRAALDVLPQDAAVAVVELTAAVVTWCEGPLGTVSADAIADRRVTVEVGDVFDVLARAAAPFAGIALDLWQGPLERHDHVFTKPRLAICRRALARGGRIGVWSEQSVGGFEERLRAAGFAAPDKVVAKRGFRHVVYVAEAR
jgi:spermidine synthase